MKVGTLLALLEHAQLDDIVAVRVTDHLDEVLTIETAEVEHASHDGEGHVTSTGGTVWLNAVTY